MAVGTQLGVQKLLGRGQLSRRLRLCRGKLRGSLGAASEQVALPLVVVLGDCRLVVGPGLLQLAADERHHLPHLGLVRCRSVSQSGTEGIDENLLVQHVEVQEAHFQLGHCRRVDFVRSQQLNVQSRERGCCRNEPPGGLELVLQGRDPLLHLLARGRVQVSARLLQTSAKPRGDGVPARFHH